MLPRVAVAVCAGLSVFLLTVVGPQIPEARSVGVASSRSLTGQVFVVTNARQAVKLPLVDVFVVRESVAERHVKRRGAWADSVRARIVADLAPITSELDSLEKQLRKWDGLSDEWKRKYEADEITFETFTAGDPTVKRAEQRAAALRARDTEVRSHLPDLSTGAIYFEPMPAFLDSARTDAEGRFSLRVPSQERTVIFARTDRVVLSDVEHYYWVVREAPASEKGAPILLDNDNLTSSRSPLSLVKER